MSITKCPGHMRSLKLNFSATVLTLGLKARIFENLRPCKAKVLGELRTRAPFDRCVGASYTLNYDAGSFVSILSRQQSTSTSCF